MKRIGTPSGSILVVALLCLSSEAAATCWQTRDTKGKIVGYCCQAPGGPQSCHRYSAAQLEEMRKKRERLAAESRLRAERARRASAGVLLRRGAGQYVASGYIDLRLRVF